MLTNVVVNFEQQAPGFSSGLPSGENLSSGLTRPDKIWAVQPQEMARDFKSQI